MIINSLKKNNFNFNNSTYYKTIKLSNSNKSLFHSPSNFSVKIKNEEISKYISDSSPINLKKNQNFINSRTNKNISNLEFEIKNNNTLNKSIKYSLKENYKLNYIPKRKLKNIFQTKIINNENNYFSNNFEKSKNKKIKNILFQYEKKNNKNNVMLNSYHSEKKLTKKDYIIFRNEYSEKLEKFNNYFKKLKNNNEIKSFSKNNNSFINSSENLYKILEKNIFSFMHLNIDEKFDFEDFKMLIYNFYEFLKNIPILIDLILEEFILLKNENKKILQNNFELNNSIKIINENNSNKNKINKNKNKIDKNNINNNEISEKIKNNNYILTIYKLEEENKLLKEIIDNNNFSIEKYNNLEKDLNKKENELKLVKSSSYNTIKDINIKNSYLIDNIDELKKEIINLKNNIKDLNELNDENKIEIKILNKTNKYLNEEIVNKNKKIEELENKFYISNLNENADNNNINDNINNKNLMFFKCIEKPAKLIDYK